MPRSRRSSFRRTSGGIRRLTSWNNGPNGQIAAISADSNNLFPVIQQALQDGITIVRTRGELLVYLSVVGGAATEGFRWALGFAIVTENVFGVGATALPDPIVDAGWDGWLVYDTGWISTMSTDLQQASPTQSARVQIDSKAMRKMKNTDGLVAMFAVDEQGDGSQMNAQLTSRFLFKLP